MSSTKNKLTINATSSMIQVAFTAILYFFLYKYLLNTLGVQQLGVWSLILSFSSIANLANLGLTSGLVKFVADYLAEKKEEKIGKLILTSFISLALLFSIISLIILFGAKYFLHLVIDEQFLELAYSILPLSLGSLCINALSGVFTSVLEGYQKNYIRNFIYILSGMVMYIGTILLTPFFQLKGVAIAQFLQAIFVLVFSLVLMIQINPFNRIRYWKWSKKSFFELFGYGLKFQAVSICQLLYEPTTKLLLSKYGGLALLGHYELANRLVNQFRSLLVSANQVVIPVIAQTVKIKSQEYRIDFYSKMNRIMLLFTFPLSTLLILLTPMISFLWIGSLSDHFIYSVYILTIGYIVNIMSGPSFFSCMGEGRLNIPLLSHLIMALVNIALGCLFGYFWGGYGIIMAWGIALIIGSLVTIIFYQKRIQLSFGNIFTFNDWEIIVISLFLIVGSIILFTLDIIWLNNMMKTIFILVLSIILYGVVLRKNDIIKTAKDFILKKKV